MSAFDRFSLLWEIPFRVRKTHFLHTCLNVKSPFSAFRTKFGGVSGRRGLSGPISEPLDSESCILSQLLYVKFNCFRRCKRVISSRIF